MHFCDDRGCLSLFHHCCELDGAIVEDFDARCRASNPNRSNWGVNLHIAALSDAACNKVECPFSEADQSSIRVSMRVVDVFIQFHLSIVGTTEGCAVCKYDTERTIHACLDYVATINQFTYFDIVRAGRGQICLNDDCVCVLDASRSGNCYYLSYRIGIYRS